MAVPLAGFILLSVWIQQKWDLGKWVIVVGVLLGVVSGIDSLRQSLKTMGRMGKDKKEEPPPVSFNDHD